MFVDGGRLFCGYSEVSLRIYHRQQTNIDICNKYFIHKNRKSKFWCIDFHKYKTHNCLNQGTIFCWRTPTLTYVVREVLQLSGEQLEEEAQKQHMETASPTG